MKLVIDLSHNLYESLIKGYELSKLGEREMRKAIQHGTPLPEHHGRLIDISKVEFLDIEPIRAYDKGWHNAVRLCVETLRDAPTVLEATKEGDGE